MEDGKKILHILIIVQERYNHMRRDTDNKNIYALLNLFLIYVLVNIT